MKRRARNLVLGLLVGCVAAALGLYLWLPWDPFEAPAGNLDRWVPRDVDAVIRFDAGGLAESSLLNTLWDGPAGARLRDVPEVADALQALRDADAELARLPLADGAPSSVAGDLAGAEVLVALRGGEALVLTRISDRAKAIALLGRVGDERRAKWGVRAEGGGFVVGGADAPQIRFAVRRDVLVVSTSKSLFDGALELAAGRGTGLASRGDYVSDPAREPHGPQASAWAEGRFVRELAGMAPLGDDVVRVVLSRPVRMDIDARGTSAVTISAVLTAPNLPLAAVRTLFERAAQLAGPDAISRGALPLSARDVVRTLVDAQPASRRRLLDELLAEGGTSIGTVIDDLARHLADGVGFVVERLPETDALRLDEFEGDPVEPIPATFAVFRLTGDDPSAFLADLERHATALFGEDARLAEGTPVAGMRVFHADASAFGPEWKLLTPALAVSGPDVVFASNRDALVRAIQRPAAGRTAGGPESVATFDLSAPMLARRLLDLRWEVASRATYHDWGAERRAFRAELAKNEPALSPMERAAREEAEITRRVAERKDREFPAEIRRHRESVRWLEGLDGLTVRVRQVRDSLTVDAEIRLAKR